MAGCNVGAGLAYSLHLVLSMERVTIRWIDLSELDGTPSSQLEAEVSPTAPAEIDEPIIVSPDKDVDLVDGHHRTAAMLQWAREHGTLATTRIPAIVVHDDDLLELAADPWLDGHGDAIDEIQELAHQLLERDSA